MDKVLKELYSQITGVPEDNIEVEVSDLDVDVVVKPEKPLEYVSLTIGI